MAEIIPTIFANQLAALITEEANLLLGVEDQLKSLLLKLKFLGAFLSDAEKKRQKSDVVELWIGEIREVTYEAEDAIDAYMLHLEQRRAMNQLRKLFHSWKNFTSVHRTGKQIERINTKLQNISECRLEYGISASETSQDSEVAGMAWRQRQRVAMADEITYKEAVGFKNESVKLIKLLEEADQTLKIVSIFGMGGLGKTTLANKIYRNQDVYFDVRLCITVSQMYQLKDLFQSLLKQLNCVTSDKEKEDYQSLKDNVEKEDWLKDKLWKELSDKKYLLIIDDIWKAEAWDQIRGAFPDNNKGSRIILTTRIKEVALYANPSRYASNIELRGLNTEDSFELFCRNVFSKPNVECSSELVNLGKKIVSQCGGLPLAIIVIGGLLKGKERIYDAWSKVLKSVKWHLSQDTNPDTNPCRPILMLSYSDLPSDLKSCFLYLGLFPEDFLIDAKKLVRLLVAEGFVQAKGQLTMEEVAENCVEELVQRSLIGVKDRDYHGGPISKLQMHDLLHDIATTEGRKDRFLDIHTTSNIGSRRLAIHPGTTCEDGYFPNTAPNLRSLLFFVEAMPTFPKNRSKMLRVLDLEGVHLSSDIPKEIGELSFLRYLGLAYTGIGSLPSSIGKLIKLQTLDVSRNVMYNVTNSIWKLKNLRHLLIQEVYTAKGVVGEDFGRNLLTLEVSGDMWLNESGLRGVLVKHECLRSLRVYGVLKLNSDVKNLKTYLPSSLTELVLENTDLEEDPSDILGSLPSLKSLTLGDFSFTGKEMVFRKGSFPQLHYLNLSWLEDLLDWRVEDGSMPILTHLKIHELNNLKKLPDGLRSITSLQRIEVYAMPQLKERIKEKGEDWDIIKHVPLVQYFLYPKWQLAFEMRLGRVGVGVQQGSDDEELDDEEWYEALDDEELDDEEWYEALDDEELESDDEELDDEESDDEE